MQSRNSKGLGDNPAVVWIGVIASLISILVFVTGYENIRALFAQIMPPMVTQTSSTPIAVPSDTPRPPATAIQSTFTYEPTNTPVPPTATQTETPIPPTATQTEMPIPPTRPNPVVAKLAILSPQDGETITSNALTVRWTGPSLSSGYGYRVFAIEFVNGTDIQSQYKDVTANQFEATFQLSDFSTYSPGSYTIRIFYLPPGNWDRLEGVLQSAWVFFTWSPP